MGVLIRRGRTKMVINLRSLALLTGSFTEVGLINNMNDDVNDDTIARWQPPNAPDQR